MLRNLSLLLVAIPVFALAQTSGDNSRDFKKSKRSKPKMGAPFAPRPVRQRAEPSPFRWQPYKAPAMTRPSTSGSVRYREAPVMGQTYRPYPTYKAPSASYSPSYRPYQTPANPYRSTHPSYTSPYSTPRTSTYPSYSGTYGTRPFTTPERPANPYRPSTGYGTYRSTYPSYKAPARPAVPSYGTYPSYTPSYGTVGKSTGGKKTHRPSCRYWKPSQSTLGTRPAGTEACKICGG